MSTTTILKPHYTTPHPLAGEKVPLTIFDRAAIDTFIVFLFAYRAPSPTNEALMEGLRRAVALYPLLAGRLAVDGHRGRRFLHVNDEGVLVVEATVPVDLAGVLADGAFVQNLADLYPALPEESVGAALLHIKLSRYRCGGLVIGVIWHHHAADGHSMSSFLTTWASAVREGEAFAVPTPFHDRAATAVPRSVPAPAFDHRSTEFRGEEGRSYPVVPMDKIKNLAVRFSAEFIAELKARVGARCTTFQCVLAHVWKKTTAARGLQPDEFTQVRIAVNCRRRADPPAPAEFFGNMVLWAFPRLQVRDLLSSSYGGVVAAIRDAVARVDGEYIRSFVDFGGGEVADEPELTATAAAPGTMFCPDMEVDSWLGFRFHEIDFGSGPQSAFLPPDLPVEGLMIFIPSCRAAKGGVDVFMAVAEDHVKAFLQICHSLD